MAAQSNVNGSHAALGGSHEALGGSHPSLNVPILHPGHFLPFQPHSSPAALHFHAFQEANDALPSPVESCKSAHSGSQESFFSDRDQQVQSVCSAPQTPASSFYQPQGFQ
ncbi:hypothetical protein AAVH_41823 [Aphelenchoides avenae]|nr:hypothetical protein AAVH_41823 [Aphelenchus avenae]